MIIDHIKNAALYAGLGKRIQTGLEWLAATDFNALAPGRYELDGNNLYALVQTYETKDPALGKWEAHRRYIDIQYVVSGCEKMGYAEINTLNGSDYDSEKDFQLLVGDGDLLTCGPGTFILFAPQDAHMPCLTADKPQTVTKVVVKVLAG